MSRVLFQALFAALDHLSVGFVACLPTGQVLHLNRSAREMVERRWPIGVANGLIQGEDRQRTASLLRGLERIARDAPFAEGEDISLDICLAKKEMANEIAVATLKPLVVDAAECPDLMIGLFITRLGRASFASMMGIADCFDLTPAETRTLELFASGGSVAEVAHALGLSENTVKTHLQKLFTKTRSSRQSHLVRIVGELTPPLREGGSRPSSIGAHRQRGLPRFDGLRHLAAADL